jgi:N-carbamoylputrescine amidase
MSRIVRCSLIQASNAAAPNASLEATKQVMIDKHVGYIRQAAGNGEPDGIYYYTDLDLDLMAEVRKAWPSFRERRPDMYESLVKA